MIRRQMESLLGKIYFIYGYCKIVFSGKGNTKDNTLAKDYNIYSQMGPLLYQPGLTTF